MFIGMEVVGVRVEMPSNQPIVLLKEIEGSRFLPIWVGAAEASAIAFAQQQITPPRPLTHDLMSDLFSTLGATLRAVHLTEVKDGIFFANLIIGQGSEPEHKLSARPSDAIALALRTHSEILASTELLDEAGIEIPVEAGGDNQEVERFRQFLEEINPDDFAG